MSDSPDARVFPLFLRLEGRRVLVVGGGLVARQKIEALVAAGARVHVVAVAALEDVRALARCGAITLDERAFAEQDVADAWLVVSATNDPSVNARVRAEADRQRIFSCAVDDLASTSAFFGSVVERAPFVVAISSRGAAPALTRLVREVVESVLPAENWVETARELRRVWKAERRPMGDRFPELVRRIASG